MGHYYTKDGQPAHTQPTKRGAKSETRPTDIRDARKLGLFPSVTTIFEVKRDAGLSRWIEDQLIEACYRCAPTQDTLGEYNAFIREEAGKGVEAARQLGELGHAALESFFGDGSYADTEVVVMNTPRRLSELVGPALDMIERLNIQPIAAEKTLVNSNFGYAGTTDLIFGRFDGIHGIMDFKFKKSKPGKPPFDSTNHAMQLAAYYQAYFGQELDADFPEWALCYNILISTTEIGRVDVLERTPDDLRKAWRGFKAVLNLWEYENDYSAANK